MLATRELLGAVGIAVFLGVIAHAETIKVRIDATPEDREKLAELLIKNSEKTDVEFAFVESEYQVRIAMEGGRSGAMEDFMGNGGAYAAAAVLTPDCKLLFVVSRGGRLTRNGAMNALSKEIVKLLPRHIVSLATEAGVLASLPPGCRTTG